MIVSGLDSLGCRKITIDKVDCVKEQETGFGLISWSSQIQFVSNPVLKFDFLKLRRQTCSKCARYITSIEYENGKEKLLGHLMTLKRYSNIVELREKF